MKKTLIPNKIEYCFIDRSFPNSSNKYSRHKYIDPKILKEIEENRKAVASTFNQKDLITLNQVHKDNVVRVDASNLYTPAIEADGVISTTSNLILGIITADCVPVLLSGINGDIIGALHCSWKSASLGIIDNIIEKVQAISSQKIVAVIGPSILQKSYEVSLDFYTEFVKQSNNNKALFIPGIAPDKYLFDLPGYVKLQLNQHEVEIVEHIAEDTYSNPNKYPSRRRSFHQNEPYTDNLLSMILIK